MYNKLIEAIIYAFGMSQSDARKYANKIDEDMKRELINEFETTAIYTAYND